MEVTFITENNFIGYVPRTDAGRTDTSWMAGLNAYHYSYNRISAMIQSNEAKFDGIVICIIPKNNPVTAITLIRTLQKCSSAKFAIMQEGPHDLFHDWSISVQFMYMELLNELDLIFCHNEYDKNYFQGLVNIPVYVLKSLMIEESIPNIKYDNRSGVMIGGNMVRWYNGIDSLSIATIFNEPIYAPSMGRKQRDEDSINDITYIDYKHWPQWLLELSKRKYAVHMMRTYAAGTFALNCSRLGIPCIGWGNNTPGKEHGCDTQRLLFPELTIPEGNMSLAIKTAKHLKENELFFNHVVEYAKKVYNDVFSEKAFINSFNNIIQELK